MRERRVSFGTTALSQWLPANQPHLVEAGGQPVRTLVKQDTPRSRLSIFTVEPAGGPAAWRERWFGIEDHEQSRRHTAVVGFPEIDAAGTLAWW